MSNKQESNIWRNIGAIPAAIVAWFAMNWIIGDFVLDALMGEDHDRQHFLFIIPVQPVALWVIPIFQSFIVPGVCVTVAYFVATSQQTYFAVITATIIVMILLFAILVISFSPLEIEGMLLFKTWLCFVISIGSVAWGLVEAFKTHKEEAAASARRAARDSGD